MRAFFWGFFIFLLDSLILIAIVEFGFNRRDILSSAKQRIKQPLPKQGFFVALALLKVFFLLGAVCLLSRCYADSAFSLCLGAFIALIAVVAASLYRDRITRSGGHRI